MCTVRALLMALLVAMWGCDDGGPADGDGDGDVDGDGDGDSDADADGDEPPDEPFAVTGVVPNHGIFSGFSSVVVRGRGFEEGAQVFFGDSEVLPATIVVADENRIGVLTPPGEPDSFVDVRVVQGEEEAVLEDGFYYDPCSLSPDSGSVAGGTFVIISCLGTELEAGLSVTFDGEPATDVEVVSDTEIHLYTPPGRVGPADVFIDTVTRVDGIRLAEAYAYFENTDPTAGGLGGDPIDGNIDVTVFDGGSGAPLSDSFVIVGSDGGTEYQGRTDASGHIGFSGPDLSGRQLIITVSHAPVPTPIEYACSPGSEGDPDGDGCCEGTAPDTLYQTASFTSFDATYVTVLLTPVPPMIMIMPCDSTEGVPSFISGEVMFESAGEFGPYDWEIVPEPLPPNEMKITFVQTTAPDIFYDELRGELYTTGTIDGGPESIVTEENVGENGFTYRIQSRYGVVAVYALAGIYNTETGAFTPYAFGIHRGVLVPPGEEVEGIDIMMVTTLTETVIVDLDGPPGPEGIHFGPNQFTAELYVDLGVEGIIWRPDRISTRDVGSALHRFSSWMPREGALADATLTVAASAMSVQDDMLYYPFARRYLRGVENWRADVVVGDWIMPAEPVDPDYYDTAVTDDHLEWDNGDGTFHFTNGRITRGSPYWSLVMPDTQESVDLPPLPAESVPDVSEAQLDIWHHRVQPGFVFDRFAYDDFGRDVQDGYTANAWLITFP